VSKHHALKEDSNGRRANSILDVDTEGREWSDTANVETFRRMSSPGMLCHVALVRTDVSEKCIASIIRVTRVGELGTTLAVIRLLTLFLAHRYVPWKRRLF
jgi:hypothetical protein